MPAAAPGADPPPTGGGPWLLAPCMLVTLGPDDRVSAVNNQYLERTGHTEHDVLGRLFWDDLLSVGSRIFYQTQLAPVLQMDGQLEEIMVDLRTAGRDRVPALLNVTRRVDADGATVETIIAMMSVPDRRAFEDNLRHARSEAEAAQALTEAALDAEAHIRRRLELLAQANTALTGTLDTAVALDRLARVLAERLADWCIVQLAPQIRPAGSPWAVAHLDASRRADTELLARTLQEVPEPGSVLRRLIDGGVPVLGAVLVEPRDAARRRGVDEQATALGSASLIVVPVWAQHTQVATIVLGRGSARSAFSDDDLVDALDVAARTGLVIGSLRRQAREHSNSMALQNALLTTPPTGSGFQIATRYQPATAGNDVGGDWYDALLRPDGSLVLTIGDVVGHDILAAAAMGHLRGITRTLAYTTPASPAGILTQTDGTARGLGVDVLASAIVAQLVRAADGTVTFECSNAGHPPPLLVSAGGTEVLEIPPDPLLGLRTAHERHDHTRILRPGDTLIFYTDGLVEHTDDGIDDTIAALAGQLGAFAAVGIEALCDRMLDARTGNTRDDIAVIAVRIDEPA